MSSSPLSLAAVLLLACQSSPSAEQARTEPVGPSYEREDERAEMVARQLIRRGVHDQRVLDAMRAVPRHRFVPADERAYAYADRPLPIGHGVTISQPFIVARMTELARIEAGDVVLEVGTGSGYQAAVLAELGARVYTIERIEALARRAEATLRELGYDSVEVRYGDGYLGWPEHAPFDAILLTAAPPQVPDALTEQLAIGGRLVAPVGIDWQKLVVVERTKRGFTRERVDDVAFVPMLPGTTPD